MTFRVFYILCCILLLACKPALDQLELETLQGKKELVLKKKADRTIYFFLSPDCPLSQNYSVQIKQIAEILLPTENLLLIIPSEFYSKKEIEAFLMKYQMSQINCLLDPEKKLINRFEVSVSPEVVLYDNQNNRKVFQGKIDNWIEELGVKRREASEHYLKSALLAHRERQDLEFQYIRPIGCYIE